MKRGLVVYTTRTKDTEKIANLVAEGMRFGGMEAKVLNVKDVKNEQDLDGYDAYAFGAPTYHGEMLQAMKTFLFLAEKADLAGKIGGAFGAFGWSGESPDRIFDTMKNIFKMDMVSQSLRLKNADLGGGVAMAQDYGRDMAKKAG
ncbi:Flavodoxin domain-containing protein [Desulfatibacillum alkenivorans DSM 16219]|jgi:flavorubredoxin|uniref:Flavodoxin domain-containing protein n=1 Tax=Desulfatibacillum alkenivorans DSM 16219 TaxID=1121393 RepID=A0A1M6E7P7_9BACT|nr:flavodoxin domain-containing protein [Desulfatibacillum alkenivorans]SHI81433.1 Flavodoxin domain-containing protein [Desulfatibacillum alkenivorans DSM 16219]